VTVQRIYSGNSEIIHAPHYLATRQYDLATMIHIPADWHPINMGYYFRSDVPEKTKGASLSWGALLVKTGTGPSWLAS
jgi:hypothetical protein